MLLKKTKNKQKNTFLFVDPVILQQRRTLVQMTPSPIFPAQVLIEKNYH